MQILGSYRPIVYLILWSAGYLAAGGSVLRGADEPGLSRTFSIVAADLEAGLCGAAVASKYPAVGSVVPHVRPGVGAFCTQHHHHPEWGRRALELLEKGKPPGEVLAELIRDDPRSGTRQLAIVDLQGRVAQHNPWQAAGGSLWWGAVSGRYYGCQGNTLAGRQVLSEMAAAYEETKGTLADRLLAALVAGDAAGGDHRGRLAAAIIVCKTGDPQPTLDLRVDNDNDAVRELAKRYGMEK